MTNAFIAYHVVLPFVEFADALRQDAEKSARAAWMELVCIIISHGYGSIPINSIFRGMNIHLPAILMFTRYQGFDRSAHQITASGI
jgi:hypothetical protein